MSGYTPHPYAELPILAHKDAILGAVSSHRVTVVNGETGSGKSSQVPRYLSDSFPDARVLVTQPRRIAATSLARRVAEELGEPLGVSVGYAIGSERVGGPGVRVRFVTSGWLLQRLLHDPGFFETVSHVVLDEVHERSVDSDLLYLLIRQLLQGTAEDRSPRIVMMSATFDASVFVDYYAPVVGDAVPALFVGVKRFPVEVVYLEDFDHHRSLAPGIASRQVQSVLGGAAPGTVTHPGAGGGAGIAPLLAEFAGESGHGDAGLKVWAATSMMRTGAAVIDHIVAAHPAGSCVLCFLAGIAEIEDMMALLTELGVASRADRGGNALDLVVLHSLLEGPEQDRAFQPVPAGAVRVVLATNIAESSVTLPGVTHVIDAGMVKTLHHDTHAAVTRLSTVWASQSSAAQRSGRCGRLSPGTVYRLYPRSLHDRLPVSEVPEMLRLSLATTVLRLKVLASSRAEGPFSDPARALAEALQPPAPDAVRSAVTELVVAGALTLGMWMVYLFTCKLDFPRFLLFVQISHRVFTFIYSHKLTKYIYYLFFYFCRSQ
jgi:HrpA-like RNA helicase